MKVKEFLETTYPELKGHVTGDNYPIPPIVELGSQFMSLLQIMTIAWIVLGGERVLRFVGFTGDLPRFYHIIQEYGFQLGAFIFLILPQIINNFAISGSFEVYLDQALIFSKIAEGRMPGLEDLIAGVDTAGLTRLK